MIIALVALIVSVSDEAKAATPLRVMPLGDSITRGIGDGSADGLNDGYRCAFKNLLKNAGQPIDYVGSLTSGPTQCTDHDIQHEGHSGWTTTQILGSVAGWVTTYQPDVVLLMIGTNDIKLRQWDGLSTRLGLIIDTIHTVKPDAKVIVSTIVQYNYNLDQATIDAWNAYKAAVPTVAYEHDAYLAYNDNVIKRMLADNIHPAQCAYDNLMPYNWYAAFSQAVDAPNKAGWPPAYPSKAC